MTAVLFTRRGYGYTLTFRYDPGVVETIKNIVPSYDRSWVPARREWLIEDIWAQPLAGALRAAGHRVSGLDEPRCTGCSDTGSWAQQMFRAVGPARAPATYRLMSKVCHPDAGGTGELFRDLDNAYRQLTERKTA